MINKGLFTSKTDEWATPQWLFDGISDHYNFVLDVCATKENTKCNKYYTKEQDGLSKYWNHTVGWKWMNPPYGREIGKWVQKASVERKVVALLPARVDTKWFHEYIYDKPDTVVTFVKGRVKFGDSKNSAPFPSMIVVFKGYDKE